MHGAFAMTTNCIASSYIFDENNVPQYLESGRNLLHLISFNLNQMDFLWKDALMAKLCFLFTDLITSWWQSATSGLLSPSLLLNLWLLMALFTHFVKFKVHYISKTPTQMYTGLQIMSGLSLKVLYVD